MKPKPLAISLLAVAFLFCVVQTVEAGKLRRLIFNNYSGSYLTNLYTTNNLGFQTFPATPDSRDFLPNGEPNSVYPPFNAETVVNTGAPETYGSLIQGYLTAPETGDYTFWLASDDEGEFLMTTDPADPLNPSKTNLLCWVPGWSGTREWAKFPQQQSSPVSLEQGKTYYVELRHKEGTGGDHIVLGWQTPSGALERPMPAWHFQPIRYSNPLFAAEPDVEVVVGPTLPRTPGDPFVDSGNLAVIYANVNLDQPVTYQWIRGSSPVLDATNAYYILRANISDDNSQWSVQARSGGTTYSAGPMTLSVIDYKPTVVSASVAPQNPTLVQVVFSEDVTAITATNLANYSLPGATIQSATLAADNRTVNLRTSLLTPTQVYTLSISGVQDMATPANTMDPATTTFVIADGSINFRVYAPVPPIATDLVTLSNATRLGSTSPTYNNDQFTTDQIVTTTSIGWNVTPLRDNYMGQMIGYVTAPESGQYKFAIASDDQSILYLGTTDQRSSKRQVCFGTAPTGRWNLGQHYPNSQSALITLQAGQRYYIEAVYRDGTGGDGVTVCWQTPTDLAMGNLMPTNNASTQAATQPFLIPARYLSRFTAFGNLFFRTNLPATLSAAAGTQPVLRVAVDGSMPYNYQWFRNTLAISGATTSAYTLPFLQSSDNGAAFSVTVTNNFSSTNSASLVLTVTADATRPAVASVGSLFKQTVEVRFTEPVSALTGGDPASYLLFNSTGVPVAITGAVLDGADPSHVTLQTAAMPETDLIKLVVQNVADVSAAANIMNPATNFFRANNFDAIESINNTQPWSASANGEQVLLTGGGADIWGNADGGVFLYKSVTGNFDYKVQGVSLAAVDAWSKMGVMGRSTTAAGSRNVFNLFTAPTPFQNTYSAQVRDSTGGASTSSNDAGTPLNVAVSPGVAARPTLLGYPSWVRIQRIGGSFYYYYGANGTNWTYWTYYDSTLSPEGSLPLTLLVGLALTSHNTASTANGVMASFSAVNDGPLYFTLQPTNTTTVEGGNVTFSSAVLGSTPYYYQWLTNGIPMTDSALTNANLTITRVPFGLNGVQFAVRVTNPYGQTITSTNATLTVLQDSVAPTVRYFALPKININPTEVGLLFSEPMDRTSAETLNNYQITAIPGGAALSIVSVSLNLDERTVILTTAAQMPGTSYRVVVNGVKDQACCPPNLIPPNSTDYFFYAGSTGNFAQRSDGFVLMEAENAQRLASGVGADWQFSNSRPNYSARGYMLVPTVQGTSGGATAIVGGVAQGTGARMEYDIVLTRPATNYTVWVRGWVADDGRAAGDNDSIYIGWNGNLADLGPAPGNANYSYLQSWGSGGWDWRSDRNAGTDPLILTNIPPGTHTFIIWSREDGALVDKICIEPGVRSNAGNSTEPSQASSNGGLGDPETWDWIVAPPAAPTITITNPVNGQNFIAGSSILIEPSIVAPSPVSLVEFFSGTNLIGTATAAPWSMSWTGLPEGVYSVYARVADVLGYQTTSATVQFAIDSSKPVAYAVGSLGGFSVGVYFSDITGLDAATATNVANYIVNAGTLAVTNAVLELDNLAVMLALSAPVSGSFSVQIANVADRGFGPSVMNPATLSSSVVTWPLTRDVGTTNTLGAFSDPVMPGFAQSIGTDGFYVHAGGSDIWNTADGMHFVYLPVVGNFDVATRVGGLRLADVWSKAGIMVRETVLGTGRNCVIAATPTNGQNLITMQFRGTNGVGSLGIVDALRPRPSPIPNAWLRVTGTNNFYTFLYGTNGTDWTTLWTTNLASAPYTNVYVGLATTSHNNGTNLSNTTSAYYRDVRGLAPTVMEPPTLSAEIIGSDLLLSWPPDRIGMRLESQVNPPGAGLGTSWSTVAGSATTNRIYMPISSSQGSVFYRLAYP